MSTLHAALATYFEEQAALLTKHAKILASFHEETDSNGKKKKKKKEERDPLMPKRPPSAYLLYMADFSGPYKAAHPNLTQTEIMSNVGKQWTDGFSKQEKTLYEARAKVLKDQYLADMKVYNANKASGITAPVVTDAASGSASGSESEEEDDDEDDVPAPAPVVVAPVVPSKKSVKPVVKPTGKPAPAVAPAPVPTPAPVPAPVASPVPSKSDEKKKKRKHDTPEKAAQPAPVAVETPAPTEEKKKVTLIVTFLLKCCLIFLHFFASKNQKNKKSKE